MLKAIFTTFPFFVCLFWSAVLVIDNFFTRNRAKDHLFLFMLVSCFLYFCHCIYYNGDRSLFILYDALYAFSNLAVYPLFYLYILSLTKPDVLKIKSYFILIPSIVVGAASLISALMMTEPELSWYIDNVAYVQHSKVPFFWGKFHHITDYVRMGIFAIQIVPLVYFGLKRISDYNKEIKNYYSDTEKKTMSTIGRLMVYIVIISSCSFAVNIIGRQVFNASVLLIIPSISFGTMLFAIGYVGSKRDFMAVDFFKEVASDDRVIKAHKSEELPEPDSKNLSGVILHLITSKDLYKQPDIKVSDIAILLNTNRTYIYHAINKDLNISFSDLINHYRVECAKKLLCSFKNERPNMQLVIEESGFSSESSFYRIFKKATGKTPAQWVLSCGSEPERK